MSVFARVIASLTGHHEASSAARPLEINPLFDHAYYAATYPHLAAKGLDLHLHYKCHGWFNGFHPNAYFDAQWYVDQNDDVAVLGTDPLDHYLGQGAAEGRDPSPRFSTTLYVLLNPDVRKCGMNPLEHYLKHGYAEGRLAPPAFAAPDPDRWSTNDLARPSPASEPLLRFLRDWTAHVLRDGGDRSAAVEPETLGAVGATTDPPEHRDVRRPARPPTPARRGGETGANGRSAVLTAEAKAIVARRSPILSALAKHFSGADLRLSYEAVRVLGPVPQVAGPVVMFTNHPSKWDAQLFFWLGSLFPDHATYAPVDRVNVARYPILKRIGAFPTWPDRRGAATFLAVAEDVLARGDGRGRDGMLLVAVEGRFRDVRERPVRPMAGLVHLARRAPAATFLPLAIEYVFWDGRRPNLLLRFGPPVDGPALAAASTDSATACLATALEGAMGDLALAAQTRDPRHFQALLGGGGDVQAAGRERRRSSFFPRRGQTNPSHEAQARRP